MFNDEFIGLIINDMPGSAEAIRNIENKIIDVKIRDDSKVRFAQKLIKRAVSSDYDKFIPLLQKMLQ
ncbi:hypothetical protein [Breznakiella homolactica]|uniref:Uncharacterized protein n=1 Tax=Breznakiella homolactica TaxID=2798577 RepID=A0A7T7XPZ3_9SPIR|nr:hypothetical protein [Breznakiella homolactica]QQO10381.1 hypothetical protein JFL75_05535 [Breznakiella homolactica]